ncbi:recombinase RecT [Streptomyces sp. NRRL S-350]|uniref:recombinase RecT n=1 Tax=Streptomyces sp. NRRL S-350 TaxID=1463902 RepID=UPI0004C0007B|nr:recombinase RecT [Streptomyces sp. NRRL S-350]
MALSLKDRVKAATAPTVPAPVVEVVEGATAEELHAAQQADGGQAADVVMGWLERYRKDITAALPDCIEPAVFLAAVKAALPGLARCTPASLLQSVLTAAQFGLVPDGVHSVLKADGPLAVWVPMYRGYIDLMYRSGRVGSVHVGFVREHDEFAFEPTAPSPLDLVHKPEVKEPLAKRGPVVLAYAFAWMLNGSRSQVVVLNREEAEAVRDEYSEAYRRAEENGAKDSFWHTHFDDMWAKTALRRLAKVVPTSPELRMLTAAEDAGDAGQVQILHAPTGADQVLVAEAEQAAAAAEAGQDVPAVPVTPWVAKKPGRSKPKRPRGGRKPARR